MVNSPTNFPAVLYMRSRQPVVAVQGSKEGCDLHAFPMSLRYKLAAKRSDGDYRSCPVVPVLVSARGRRRAGNRVTSPPPPRSYVQASARAARFRLSIRFETSIAAEVETCGLAKFRTKLASRRGAGPDRRARERTSHGRHSRPGAKIRSRARN